MCSFFAKNQEIFNRRIKPFTDNMFEVYNNTIFQMNVLIHFERFCMITT